MHFPTYESKSVKIAKACRIARSVLHPFMSHSHYDGMRFDDAQYDKMLEVLEGLATGQAIPGVVSAEGKELFKLAADTLIYFEEQSSYDDYQAEDGWTDEEYLQTVYDLQNLSK